MALSETEKRGDKREKPLTKVIIRRLPPSMSKEDFLNQVSPLPEHNYMYHVKGDMSLGENAFSRAYVNFICPEDVYSFKEKFDNYVFVDSKGHEYTAVVEFAPFQKIPKKRGKIRMDPKCNTIESDSYYLEFVANLNKPIEQDAKPEYTLQLERSDDKKKDVTTPLLEFIKNKRAQKLRIREVRREEREKRKKEYEKRKEYNKYEGRYYDERKYDEKSPTKVYGKKSLVKSPKNEVPKDQAKTENEKVGKPGKEKWEEKSSDKTYEDKALDKPKEKKPEEKKEKKEIKPRFPKKEYPDNKDFKQREDYSYRDFRPKHYEEYNKKEDTKAFPKKIKKYSEKREERKMEAQKAEQKKLEQAKNSSIKAVANEHPENTKRDTSSKNGFDSRKSSSASTSADKERDTAIPKATETSEIASGSKEIDRQHSVEKEDFDDKEGSSSSRRIRNKDRPTIPLYRPGMLSKRKQSDSVDEIPKTEIKAENKLESRD